ncbi:MAG: tetratricopeptide repeat protein, partial [Armatimonadaceae bacterium]
MNNFRVPRPTRRELLLLGLLAGVIPAAPSLGAARPILLIFPSGYGKLVPVASGSEVNDGLSDFERILKAAKVVRGLLEEEAAVDAVLFDKESPAMVRALSESKVVPGPAEFTDEQKLRIGSAFGANYVVSVNARGGAELMQIDDQVARINAAGRQSFDNAGGQGNAKGAKGDKPRPVLPNLPVVAGPSLEIDAIEVRRNGKRWKDRITIGGQEAQSLADLAQKQPAYPTALASAARSLILRFLNGPLRDARLAAVDRSLLPPPAAPAPTITQAELEGKPVDPAAEATDLMRKADVLRRDGLTGSALIHLRQAVSTHPRAAAPRLALMRAYADLGRGADAADEARRALQLARDLNDDDRRELAQTVARNLASGQSSAESRTAYEAAVKANPDSVDTRVAYADLLLAQGDTPLAEVQFRIARKKDPSNADAARGLGRIVAARGDLDEALKEASETPHPLGRWTFATVVFLDAASPIAV